MVNESPHKALRDEVLAMLIENGYAVLPTPLQVGDIALDLPCVCSGPKDRLDLAVVVSRPETREGRLRLYWQVQRLVRALDAVQSRRTISVVLIGGAADASLISDLQAVARVLSVDAALPVRRLIAPLLGLELPEGTQVTLDGLALVREGIKGRHKEALTDIVESAPSGTKAVTKEFTSWVNGSFGKNA